MATFIENYDKVAEVRTLDDQAMITTDYTEKSVDFINKNAENPFFLYVPHSMPHVPIAVSEKFCSVAKDGNMTYETDSGEKLPSAN